MLPALRKPTERQYQNCGFKAHAREGAGHSTGGVDTICGSDRTSRPREPTEMGHRNTPD